MEPLTCWMILFGESLELPVMNRWMWSGGIANRRVSRSRSLAFSLIFCKSPMRSSYPRPSRMVISPFSKEIDSFRARADPAKLRRISKKVLPKQKAYHYILIRFGQDGRSRRPVRHLIYEQTPVPRGLGCRYEYLTGR